MSNMYPFDPNCGFCRDLAMKFVDKQDSPEKEAPVCSRPPKVLLARLHRGNEVIVDLTKLMEFVEEVRINGVGDVTHPW